MSSSSANAVFRTGASFTGKERTQGIIIEKLSISYVLAIVELSVKFKAKLFVSGGGYD